jgi:hypothetical protein
MVVESGVRSGTDYDKVEKGHMDPRLNESISRNVRLERTSVHRE